MSQPNSAGLEFINETERNFKLSKPIKDAGSLFNFLTNNIDLKRYHLSIEQTEKEYNLNEVFKKGVISITIMDSADNNRIVHLIEFDCDSDQLIQYAIPFECMLWRYTLL